MQSEESKGGRSAMQSIGRTNRVEVQSIGRIKRVEKCNAMQSEEPIGGEMQSIRRIKRWEKYNAINRKNQ
ncbi:hypothetical protein MTR_2g025220 [Medicago truncatula]|uniref:Uncharacterized protein n=1 Tax=Medicago truncatula TaxID=3880 RepID=G7ILR7_MEDTR|nr:hypothetical protein MTR_2g025220 [Medicago truncatula]